MIYTSLKGNDKLGDRVVTTTLPILATCPSTCAHHPASGNTCYAYFGHMRSNQHRLERQGSTPEGIIEREVSFVSSLMKGTLTRLHVAGDFVSQGHLSKVVAAVKRSGVRAWSYTHRWRSLKPKAGISLLASVENTEDMLAAHKRGFPVARVVSEHRSAAAYELHAPDGSPTGFTGIPCPEQTKGVKCQDCQLCLKGEWLHSSKRVILFAPHGARQRALKESLVQIG